MEATKTTNVQLEISFEQIWTLIQQLTDDKQVELLDKLQERLEKDKIIAIRQDRKAQYEKGLTLEQIISEPYQDIKYFNIEEEAFPEGEEIEMTDEEFLESLKEL